MKRAISTTEMSSRSSGRAKLNYRLSDLFYDNTHMFAYAWNVKGKGFNNIFFVDGLSF